MIKTDSEKMFWSGAATNRWLVVICFACHALLVQSASFAQTAWEMTPYEIDVLVAIEPQGELSKDVASDLLAGLAQRIDSIIGPTWKVSVRRAKPQLSWRILRSLSTIANDAIAPAQLNLDKVLMVGVRSTHGGFVVEARDFDCRTRRWGISQTVYVRQAIALNDSVFRALRKAFAPIAKVQFDAEKNLLLNVRASGIPTSDPSLAWFQPGDVVTPILRRNDRDGNPKENGIQEVPWTFLLVTDVTTPGKITCEVYSGTRNPLNVRRRGRIEQLALATGTPKTQTRLLLRSRTEPTVALSGYEVHTSRPGEKKTRFLGLTERDGGIQIAPDEQVLQILFIKSGGQLLARLPIVPGSAPQAIAPIPNDEPRLRAEGDLKGLRERMVDLVARREILIARIRRKISAGDFDTAEEYFQQLMRLSTRKPFIQQVDQMETSSDSQDPRVQAQIKRLFTDTRNLLAKFLDPQQISDLRTEIIRAKAAG